jgi:3-oxoacyl-[acyl-carrier-protein] synthase-3
LQIVDGFLRSRTIGCALVVASDANPGRGLSEHFPFSPVGAALSCGWIDGDCGLGRVHWLNVPDDGETFRATVGFEDSRNVLRFHRSDAMDERFASAGAEVARRCLHHSSLQVADVDVIVTAPARGGYHNALAAHLGVPVGRIVVADDEGMHTAALAAAFRDGTARIPNGGTVLLIAAGAGVTAGAALYTMPSVGS